MFFNSLLHLKNIKCSCSFAYLLLCLYLRLHDTKDHHSKEPLYGSLQASSFSPEKITLY